MKTFTVLILVLAFASTTAQADFNGRWLGSGTWTTSGPGGSESGDCKAGFEIEQSAESITLKNGFADCEVDIFRGWGNSLLEIRDEQLFFNDMRVGTVLADRIQLSYLYEDFIEDTYEIVMNEGGGLRLTYAKNWGGFSPIFIEIHLARSTN